MYLTKLVLDVRNRFALQCIYDYQKMHRSVMRLFKCSRSDAGVLYRFNPERFSLYILSKVEPDCSNVPLGMTFAGMCSLDGMRNSISDSAVFSFDLLASPCRQIVLPGKKNSCRKFLYSDEDRLKWLKHKANQNGFCVLRVNMNSQKPVFVRHGDTEDGAFYCASFRFTGVLKVVDSDKFYHAFCAGIGPGKAYGQGMLLLRRISS